MEPQQQPGAASAPRGDRAPGAAAARGDAQGAGAAGAGRCTALAG